MPIRHPDDVHSGGFLAGDEVTYDETSNNRNGKVKVINIVGGTGDNSWGKGDDGKGDSSARAHSWGKGGSGKGDLKRKKRRLGQGQP